MSTVARRPPLDRAGVVSAAIALADARGLEATTMRGLADVLQVTPMALYKHVAHREQLIDEMVDRVVGDIGDSAPLTVGANGATGDWRAAVRGRILAARGILSRHPWAQNAIETRTTASSVVLAHMDALMAAMFAGGLSADLVHHGMHALSTRMWGFTRDVMPTPTAPDDPEERAVALDAFVSAYPAIARMMTTSPHAGAACDDDEEFAFALDLLLDGLQRRHEEGWSSSS
ncbi:TetR/AcrR family transcriptional regulator [Microbacterium sp.]|uniref:TetR/AcrR family transcriptional regulator n=1 Tax=Microbacterium sp. TaxID=51671 RepID=UPI0025E51F3E|nr:TetR/AcrR family transcriptional regulator [Microbacterium sp.]